MFPGCKALTKVPTYIQTHRYKCTHTDRHTLYTGTDAHGHIDTQTNANPCIQAHRYKYTRAYRHIYTFTHMHTDKHAHMHTDIQTHRYKCT